MPLDTVIRGALRRILDPEVGASILDMGLIDAISIEDGVVCIEIVMTDRMRRFADSLLEDIDAAVTAVLPEGMVVLVDPVMVRRWSPLDLHEDAMVDSKDRVQAH